MIAFFLPALLAGNVTASPMGVGAICEGQITLGEAQRIRFEVEIAGEMFRARYGHVDGERYGAVGEVVLNEDGLYHLDSRERTLQSWENVEQTDLWLKLLFLPFSPAYFNEHYGAQSDYQILHPELIGPQRLVDGYPIARHFIQQPDFQSNWYVHSGNGSVYGAAGEFYDLEFTVEIDSWRADGSLDPAAFIKPRWRTLQRQSESFLRDLCVENTLYLQDALEVFHDLMTVQDGRQAQERLTSLGYSRLPSPYPGIIEELGRVLPGFSMPLNPYSGEAMVNTYTWKTSELSQGNFYYEPVSYLINADKEIVHFRQYTLLGFDDNGVSIALSERYGELDPQEMAAFFAARQEAVEANEKQMLDSACTAQRRAKRLAQIREKRAEALRRQREEKKAEQQTEGED